MLFKNDFFFVSYKSEAYKIFEYESWTTCVRVYPSSKVYLDRKQTSSQMVYVEFIYSSKSLKQYQTIMLSIEFGTIKIYSMGNIIYSIMRARLTLSCISLDEWLPYFIREREILSLCETVDTKLYQLWIIKQRARQWS